MAVWNEVGRLDLLAQFRVKGVVEDIARHRHQVHALTVNLDNREECWRVSG